MTPEPLQTLTIRLPEDLYEQLRKTAFDQHASMNALVVEAIRSQLNT